MLNTIAHNGNNAGACTCTIEQTPEGEVCTHLAGWRGRIEECGGMPPPSEIAQMISDAPDCLSSCDNPETVEALGRLIQIDHYLGRFFGENYAVLASDRALSSS